MEGLVAKADAFIQRGHSRQGLANAVGCSVKTIERLLAGQRIRAELAEKIATVVGHAPPTLSESDIRALKEMIAWWNTRKVDPPTPEQLRIEERGEKCTVIESSPPPSEPRSVGQRGKPHGSAK